MPAVCGFVKSSYVWSVKCKACCQKGVLNSLLSCAQEVEMYLILQYPGPSSADQLHHGVVGGEGEQRRLACTMQCTVIVS
jgi:hypothetical protein